MRSLFSLSSVVALLMVCLLACQQVPKYAGSASDTSSTNDPVTTVYVIRHGEKVISDPTDRDPALSQNGLERAEALRALLKDKPVDALFSTKYKRTNGTLRPLEEERKLGIIIYEPAAFDDLKKQVLQNYAGKTVVIAGHSNTVLSIVKAFGVEPTVAEVPESKYDHIFKITIAADNKATLEEGQYGRATN